MKKIVLYHNPNCSKSRGTLELLEQRGLTPEIVEYLETPLGRDELAVLVDQLDTEPAVLVRKDKHFKELGLNPSHYTTAEAVIEILVSHPRLMERPVAVHEGRAVIGRPPENVLGLLD
ncbi:MAG: arsenate reductase (glutaredoxin) [Myxococcota bacterium]|nr:arsenate reductase (glutaredoxin) [Myxococcota bacterium]